MTSRTVSVAAIIPAFNRATTIVRAVESVLDQTRPPDEILVVDDGSTDDTVARLAPYRDRVRVDTIDNAGAAVARNIGASHTTAEWLAFLDSDDYWFPDHLARITAAIDATGGAAGVYFDDTSRPVDDRDDASLFALADFALTGDWELTEDATDWVVRRRQPTMLQSSVFARAAWDSVDGLWPELRSRHDTHIFLRLGIGQPMCAVAGTGCQMTDDDTTGNRQMDAMGTRSRRYWHHTVALYDDVLARHGDQLDAEHRAMLATRLARGHLSLARHDLPRKPLGAAAHVARAVRADAATAFGPISRRLPGGAR
ncbi:MAG: glycosyltransferase [Acidimicrobiales bacterium]|nr:glycosyltransferase [Acidimicrobiales bacterium]